MLSRAWMLEMCSSIFGPSKSFSADRGEAVAGRVEDDAAGGLARLVQPGDQLTFEIRLPEIDLEAERRPLGDAALANLGERGGAVDRGFPLAQQIEIGAVQHEHGAAHGRAPVSATAERPTMRRSRRSRPRLPMLDLPAPALSAGSRPSCTNRGGHQLSF
jgi:hypothetical protein